MAEQVQASFDDSGMTDRYLNSLSQSLTKPSFPLFRRDIRRQHSDANALSRENVRQPSGDIALSRIDRVNVAATAERSCRRADKSCARVYGSRQIFHQIWFEKNRPA